MTAQAQLKVKEFGSFVCSGLRWSMWAPKESFRHCFSIYFFQSVFRRLIATISEGRIKRITMVYCIEKSVTLRPQSGTPAKEKKKSAVLFSEVPFILLKQKHMNPKSLSNILPVTNNVLPDRISVNYNIPFITLHFQWYHVIPMIMLFIDWHLRQLALSLPVNIAVTVSTSVLVKYMSSNFLGKQIKR